NDRIRRLTVATAVNMTISEGNGASGVPGAQIRVAVKITDSASAGVAGVTVTFAVASGSATLSATTAQTNSAGIASVSATLGQTPGPVRITASSAGLSSVTFNLTVTDVTS